MYDKKQVSAILKRLITLPMRTISLPSQRCQALFCRFQRIAIVASAFHAGLSCTLQIRSYCRFGMLLWRAPMEGSRNALDGHNHSISAN